MKKTILIAALGLFSLNIMAQDAKPEEGFVFTTVKENPITSIKNQNRSSTCWSFSTLGFIESELLRLGKGEYDLSEMFVVHKTMQDRGVNYVRYHGDSSFSPGGSFYDVMYCIKNYGIVPQEVMPGITIAPVHKHAVQKAHPAAHQRNAAHLDFAYQRVGGIQLGEHEGNVVVAAVVGHKHAGPPGGDVLPPGDGDGHARHGQQAPGPVGHILGGQGIAHGVVAPLLGGKALVQHGPGKEHYNELEHRRSAPVQYLL